MFRFEDPIYLYALVLIPVLALIRWWMMLRQRKRLRRFGDPQLVRQLMPDVSRFRPLVKFGLLLTALALLIVMLARPQMGTKISHEKRTGIETIIALDISNSMLAEDVSPSRLDRAKMMVENLVDHFTNDKIGLIVFAGEAYVQLPITSDFVSAKMFLSSIEPGLIETQGTDIAAAVNMATHSFTQEEGVGKAVIVITDGEDHEGGAVEAAEDAKKRGMRVYVLGVGSTGGAPIPDPSTGKYMFDETGNTVMSALNEDMCRQIAQAGGGAYIHVENGYAAQEQLNSELDKLSKKEISAEVYNSYDEYFVWFALAALLLLVLEVVLLERKNPLFKNLHLFRSRKAAMLLVLVMVSVAAVAQADRKYVRQGNKLFRNGQYADAEVLYRKALAANQNNPQATYNLGNALLAQKKDSAAVEEFQKAAKLETNPQRKYLAYHNIGVICQTRQMFKDAIAAYKEALRIYPHDDQTRYNLELCKRQMKNQPQGGGGGGNDDKKKDDKQDQQQQQQQQKKEEQKKEEEQEQQKPQMSKDNAEQLLNAALQQERQTQKRMQEQQRQQGRRRLQKNW